jgi:hypothetical protein
LTAAVRKVTFNYDGMGNPVSIASLVQYDFSDASVAPDMLFGDIAIDVGEDEGKRGKQGCGPTPPQSQALTQMMHTHFHARAWTLVTGAQQDAVCIHV